MTIASEAALSPIVYFTDQKQGVALMQFIDPRPMPAPSETSVILIAKQIRKMHDGKSFEPWKTLDEILDYFYQLLSPPVRSAEVMKKCMAELSYFKKYLNDAADVRPSHGDLNPGNVLFDGTPYLFVDWFSASPQNLYFDLATCAQLFYFSNEELCSSLLTNYLGHEAAQDELAKYFLMRIFMNIYYGMMLMASAHGAGVELKTLSDDEIRGLPGFAEYHRLIGAGEVKLEAAEARRKFGFVFLNNAVAEVEGEKYRELKKHAL